MIDLCNLGSIISSNLNVGSMASKLGLSLGWLNIVLLSMLVD